MRALTFFFLPLFYTLACYFIIKYETKKMTSSTSLLWFWTIFLDFRNASEIFRIQLNKGQRIIRQSFPYLPNDLRRLLFQLKILLQILNVWAVSFRNEEQFWIPCIERKVGVDQLLDDLIIAECPFFCFSEKMSYS